MHEYDAVVVGAGPAGSMAAFEIAKAGFRTLLLEKHERPGLPLCCAEGVAAGAMEELIGEVEPSWVASKINRFMMVAPDGNSVTAESERKGYILERPRFDLDLAHRAQKAGAKLVCNAIGKNLKQHKKRFETIEIEYPGGETETVRAGIFVAADGIESQLARQAGVPNRLGLKETLAALQYRLHGIDIDPHLIEFHFGHEIAPLGYIWIFPKSAASANVGICMGSNKRKDNSAEALLDRFITDRFGNPEIVSRHCGLIPTFRGSRMLRKYNLLIVGDAARVIESLSGAGIALGMASGIFAGRAVVRFLSGAVTDMAGLDKLYPGEFLKTKKEEMVRYARMRRAFEHMSDRDFDCIIGALREQVDKNNNSGINVGKLLWMILTTHPRLIRLARYMV